MTYTESCRCGATLTISGWLIREIGDPVLSFRQVHAACHQGPTQVARPLPRDPGRVEPGGRRRRAS